MRNLQDIFYLEPETDNEYVCVAWWAEDMNIEGSNVECLGVTLSRIATKENTAVPREHKVCQFAHQKNGLMP